MKTIALFIVASLSVATFATAKGKPAWAAAAKPGTTPMLKVHISLEYPAAAKSSKRNKLDFHTRIP